MNSSQFERKLKACGVVVATKSRSGHKRLALGDRISEIPVHGGRKQLGTGLMSKILKDLGLTWDDLP